MSRRKRWLVILGLLGIANVAAYMLAPDGPAQAERRQRLLRQDFKPTEFAPQRVVKPFDAIVNPPHMVAEDASQMLQPNELVLGVELDGEARAYPINQLTGPSREIFNDKLGEHSIAATW